MHLLGSAPNLHSTKEAPNSISQQACASGNWPDPRMAWVFSAWQDMVTGKEEGDCPTQERTVRLWIVTQFAAHMATLTGLSFWKRQGQALSLKPWKGWSAGTIWCRLSQPEVQGTSPCICRRKYKVFQQQTHLGNTGVLLVQDVWLSKIILLYCESPKRGI